MIFEKMADQIARDIFKCGDEVGSPADRIEFKSKILDGTERGQGGLCETALSTQIADSIKRYFESL